MGVEIERKFLVSEEKALEYLEKAQAGEYEYRVIEQAYLTTNPVVRVRKSDDAYYMTYKGNGFISREEYNLPLTEEAYDILKSKADGHIISKTRIHIPYGKLVIELDVFEAPFDYIRMAEVEFETLPDAETFIKPEWFLEEVSNDTEYHNSTLSRKVFK